MPSALPNLDRLLSSAGAIRSLPLASPHEQFLREEALRFATIAETAAKTFPNVPRNSDERLFCHLLFRPAIENFYRIIYVFEDTAKSEERFAEILGGFQRDYFELFNEIGPLYNNQIEAPPTEWAKRRKCPDVKSMLAQVTNKWGSRFAYLHYLYQIAIFDTQGNNMEVFFETAWGKSVVLPVMQISTAIEMMADYYLAQLETISQT